MKELDFGWGNPYFLLETLRNHRDLMKISIPTIDCSYGPDYGDQNLINETRKFIKKTTGITYPHIFITHGATGALSTIFKELKGMGFNGIHTLSNHGYPFYDKMIEDAGLYRTTDFIQNEDSFLLIDSPSNPEGKMYRSAYGCRLSGIWDSVYHNPIYIQNPMDKHTIPEHRLMVGSYSKVLGLTGARVGFIATDDDMFSRMLANRHLYELATISIFTQKLILDLLLNLDLDKFMLQGRNLLNDNRSEFQKIEKYFDGQPVQENGMFYFARADVHTKDLLKRCNVKYVDFSNDYVRMNIGQTRKTVSDLIIRIKKEDRI